MAEQEGPTGCQWRLNRTEIDHAVNPRSLLLIQVGTPPDALRATNGDLPHWFCRALGCDGQTLDVVRVFEGEALPRPGAHRAAIITGSAAMVTDRHPWSEATAQWIREAMAVHMPLFGVCYGHQLMAHALGGEVIDHPEGLEVGCHAIELRDPARSDPLLQDFPPRFKAHLSHWQTVLKLPPGARALAYSAHDPHQIIRYSARAMSTQFHPEFTPEISRVYVDMRTEVLRQSGKDAQALLADIEEAPLATELLRRFVRGLVSGATPPSTAESRASPADSLADAPVP